MDHKLLDQVIDLTGLPSHFVRPRLEAMLQKKGIEPEAVTLDDLRVVLVDFLQDVIVEAKETARECNFIS
ncbi:MAG: hypothetical protein R2827_04065 [Bdellovibrionales bacterium]